MGDAHSKSFFGQNTGLIINSSSKNKPYFYIRCIKKKPEGSWEKPTAGEGKVIKCSLDEAVMILEVLNRKQLNWTSYHTYKDNKTSISFGWEDESAKTLWINIANYSKMLIFAQAEIFRLLLTHILKEKIKYATQANRGNTNNNLENELISNNLRMDINNLNEITPFKNNFNQQLLKLSYKNQFNDKKHINPKSSSKNNLFRDMTTIKGAIKGETGKALLIGFDTGQEIWIPKSTIHCQFSPKKLFSQSFLIDNWILKRNKILT